MIEQLKKIIDEYKGEVDFIEAINISSSNTPISVKANKINSIESNYSDGIGIRLIKNNKVGFSFSNNVNDYKKVVESALQSSVYGDEIKFDYPKNEDLIESDKELLLFSKATDELTVDDMKKTLTDFTAELEQIEKMNIDSDISKTTSNVAIVNSFGRSGAYKKSSFSLSAYGVKVDENGLLWVGGSQSNIDVNRIDKQHIIDEFKTQLYKTDVLSNPSKSGKISVVFSPSAYGFLLETFSLGINGKNHYKKTSPLYNKLGEKVLGDNITLIEDPLSNELIGSAKFDRELIPTTRKYLFKNGVYQSILTDVKTANQLQITPSGNSAGGYSSVPGISVRNLIIEAGKKSLETLLSEDSEVLYVHSVLGGGQSNMLAGDFSVNVALGFHIVNGERVGKVKNIMLSGNVYDIFKDAELSKEHIANGAKDIPYIKFNNMSVSV